MLEVQAAWVSTTPVEALPPLTCGSKSSLLLRPHADTAGASAGTKRFWGASSFGSASPA